MSYYLTIIGSNNAPVYELDIGSYKQNSNGIFKFPDNINNLKQFIANSSLDILENIQFNSQQHYFNNIDSFYGYSTFIFLTQSNIKYIILTNSKNLDESIRQFFIELNELYLKKLLSPFYDYNSPINSKFFTTRVKNIAKKYL
ncbi:TRAPP subunit [Pichia kluyveri]|uniref:TRAPP subunit n=1 Tax=Pichia kluyveri TaxID=36015 RepID=A0AAV5QXU8_PICKL|nr:TRAPP subunit [Pichia kluyveri]